MPETTFDDETLKLYSNLSSKQEAFIAHIKNKEWQHTYQNHIQHILYHLEKGNLCSQALTLLNLYKLITNTYGDAVLQDKLDAIHIACMTQPKLKVSYKVVRQLTTLADAIGHGIHCPNVIAVLLKDIKQSLNRDELINFLNDVQFAIRSGLDHYLDAVKYQSDLKKITIKDKVVTQLTVNDDGTVQLQIDHVEQALANIIAHEFTRPALKSSLTERLLADAPRAIDNLSYFSSCPVEQALATYEQEPTADNLIELNKKFKEYVQEHQNTKLTRAPAFRFIGQRITWLCARQKKEEQTSLPRHQA